MVVTMTPHHQERPLPRPPDPVNNPAQAPGHSNPTLYSEKLKTNVTWDNRLKRNILEITLEKDDDAFIDIGSESIARLFKTLGINIEKEVEGYFQKNRSIHLWLVNGVDLDRFCKNESIRVTDRIKTGFIRPAGKKEVTVTVSGLDFNTPDKFVMEYLGKFGSVVNNRVIYEKYKEGIFQGKCNGDRKYQVDFTKSSISMGTYHIIDGSRVRVHYPGNKKTCGRCHKIAEQCKGDAVAKSCEENQGVRIELQEHMRSLWEKVGFIPQNFQLSLEDDEINDVVIKDAERFSPKINRPEASEDEKSKFNGIVLKNFPRETKKVDIINLLKSNGLDKNFTQDNIIFGTHGNVEICKLSATSCQEIIKNIHFPESRHKFFGKPIYCRATRDLTPVKPAEDNPHVASSETVEERVIDLLETDSNGFVFEAITVDRIDSKLINGDGNTSDSDGEDNVNLDLAKQFLKSPRTPTVINKKKRMMTTPSTASSQKVEKKKTKTQ